MAEQLQRRLTASLGGHIRVTLFGSTARGEASEESDLDVLVVLPDLEKSTLDTLYEPGKPNPVQKGGQDQDFFIRAYYQTIRRKTTLQNKERSGMQPTVYQVFRRLHESGCFVIPNPWDIGSARLLVQLGFPALATTSSGFAWSLGRTDHDVSLEEILAHLRSIAAAVGVPVNADFEDGFALEPDAVAANVAAAAQTGIAGLSIEDSTGDPSQPLFDFQLSVERIEASRRAIDESGRDIFLTGRSEGFIAGQPDLPETIRRLTAYAEAGADCLYAPGIRRQEEIEAVVQAVAPKPVNVLASSDFATVAQLADMGVRRISVGGALARAAWSGFLEAAREIAGHGSFTTLGRAVSSAEINGLLGES